MGRMSLFNRLKKRKQEEEVFQPGFGGKPISQKKSEPSTRELQDKVKRLKLEKQLKKLEPERKERGQRVFESLTSFKGPQKKVTNGPRRKIA